MSVIKTYTGRYLPHTLLKDCFIDGQIKYLDKYTCGCGLTYGFLFNMKPKEGTVDILIEPNVSTVIDKQTEYNEKVAKGENIPRAIFISSDKKSDKGIPNTIEKIVITVDSFVTLYKNAFSQRTGTSNRLVVGRILVDEIHKVYQDLSYRTSLRGLRDHLEYNYPNTAILYTTATPSVFTECDYIIKPETISRRVLNITRDMESVIDKIDKLTSNNEKVLLFTNDSRILLSLSKEKVDRYGKTRFLEVDVKDKVGDSFFRSLCKKLQIISNKHNTLTVCSSRGFEGWSDNREDVHVFVLQNADNDYEAFGVGNVLQAIERTRKGYKSATYCRIGSTNLKPIDELISKCKGIAPNILGSKSQMMSKGFTSRDYSRIASIMIQTTTANGECFVDWDVDALDSMREMEDFLKNGLKNKIYIDYLNDRGIDVINIDDENQLATKNKEIVARSSSSEKYIKLNKESIISRGSLKGFDLPRGGELTDEKRFSYFYRNLKEQLVFDSILIPEHNRRKKVMDFISKTTDSKMSMDSSRFDKLISDCLKSYVSKNSLDGIRKGSEEYKERVDKVAAMNKNIVKNTLKLMHRLCSDFNYTSEANKTWFREYSELVVLSKDIITKIVNTVLSYYNTEVDIKSCAPRVLALRVNMDLPLLIYGENKKNKQKINKLMNQVHKSHNKKLHHLKRDLKKYLPIEMVNYLIDNHYDSSYRGTWNNDYTQTEYAIVSKLMKELPNGLLYFRRHDSVIILHETEDLPKDYKQVINDFEFDGKNEWFDKFYIDWRSKDETAEVGTNTGDVVSIDTFEDSELSLF